MKMLNISRYHSYRAIVVAVCATLALLLGITLSMRMAYATSDKPSAAGEHIITVHDNGVDTGFITKKSTLRGALGEAGIRLDAMDRTEPGVDEQLVANSYQVNIYRARPVVIRDGAVETKVTTSYRTPKQITKEANITLHDEDDVTMATIINPTSVGAAEVMTIDRATGFQFDFYGKSATSYTMGQTVGAMLKGKGITMGPSDGINPSVSTPITAGMQVRLWRDGVQTVTVDEDIPFEVRQIKDVDQPVSYKLVKTPGVKGAKTVSYQVELRNGVEISRKEIQSITTKEPQQQEEVVGAKGTYTTPSQNQQITWDYLIGQGFTRVQAAGIMGNLMQEHKFNTSGDGLVQWAGGRKAQLLSRADPYNIYTQLDFLMHELNGSYRGVQNEIRASDSLEDTVRIFQNKFERCGVCSENSRVNYALNILASH